MVEIRGKPKLHFPTSCGLPPNPPPAGSHCIPLTGLHPASFLYFSRCFCVNILFLPVPRLDCANTPISAVFNLACTNELCFISHHGCRGVKNAVSGFSHWVWSQLPSSALWSAVCPFRTPFSILSLMVNTFLSSLIPLHRHFPELFVFTLWSFSPPVNKWWAA